MKDFRGLTARQAEELRKQWGENRIGGKKKSRALSIFLGQFRDAMILILLAATAVSAGLGDYTGALTIIAIVLLNAGMGFLQEYRTEKTLERLAELSAPGAEVIRDGERKKVEAWELVPGDIVAVEAGSRVAADGLLLDAVRLSCDESILTGESEGVEKAVCESGDGGRVFMGTLVTGGHGLFQVTATGNHTKMGGIAGMLEKTEQPETPLQRQLAHLSTVIGISCLGVCALVAGVGILRGEDWMQMLLTGISLAVAAVPEGLPAIVTISLAMSVGRMVKQNALIRRLPAVEALGCAGVICTDKTGTLTENRMTVRKLLTAEGEIQAERQGGTYSIRQDGKTVSPENLPGTRLLLQTAMLCNHAELVRKAGSKRVQGEATEAALLEIAVGLGMNRPGGEITAEQPFDSTRKRMSVCFSGRDGLSSVYAKGAPDYLLPACDKIWTTSGIRELSAFQRDRILKQAEEMGGEALRVLAFAYRPAKGRDDTEEKGLIYLGLAGLLDPPRREVYQAVEACRGAHIRPVMITGDLAVTARAIAQELKIWREGDMLLTGQELDRMNDRELEQKIGRVSVFARVTPEHKLRIVRILKKQGEVVAMTGDGVNDAPALREADIGVAMGKGGTDVAREASSLILLDDNFATLVQAVREGRIIYQNIRRFIRYLLSCNTGEVLTMFCAMAMGMPVPLLPIQILLVNLITDGLPAVALGLEPGEPGLMGRRPRRKEETVFAGGLGGVILLRGALIAFTTLLIFGTLLREGAPLELARTSALVTLILTQLLHAFECKSEERGLFSICWWNNPALLGAEAVSLAAVGFAVWCPALNPIFMTVPVPGEVMEQICTLSLAAPLFSGIYLAIARRRRNRRGGGQTSDNFRRISSRR